MRAVSLLSSLFSFLCPLSDHHEDIAKSIARAPCEAAEVRGSAAPPAANRVNRRPKTAMGIHGRFAESLGHAPRLLMLVLDGSAKATTQNRDLVDLIGRGAPPSWPCQSNPGHPNSPFFPLLPTSRPESPDSPCRPSQQCWAPLPSPEGLFSLDLSRVCL